MQRVAVIGAGTMGRGIAQAAATAGLQAQITHTNGAALEAALASVRVTLDAAVTRGKLTVEAADAALGRLTATSDLAAAVRDADLVIEAIVEDLDAKRTLFSRLDDITRGDAILATNTSSLSVRRIAEATTRPARVMGMHFFNPVHIMKLVELVVHPTTDPAIVSTVRDVVILMGKTPIVVQDSPGFASSRLGVVLGLEAMRMFEAGVASAEDIDRAMEHPRLGHPMGRCERPRGTSTCGSRSPSRCTASSRRRISSRRTFFASRFGTESSARRPARAFTSGRAKGLD